MIVGVDEVGRGCWAGPLVVGAVVLHGPTIEGLTDSKLLTPKRRTELARIIRYNALSIGIGWVSAPLIDTYGLTWALKRAAEQAVAQISVAIDEIIIDGTFNFLQDDRVTTLKKADLLVPSVSAASIVAKVARDAYMTRAAKVFPHHGFEAHVGYGTQGHQAALKEHGPTKLHRMSFAPLKDPVAYEARKIELTLGRQAEAKAATFLEAEGFTILERNWRTKWCEIDIIAKKGRKIHFVEVKYRRTNTGGDGIAAITPAKLRQMSFAAELWLQRNKRSSVCTLSAISLSGDTLEIDAWLPALN
ncbi:MAG TPA: ribonuclease HII [Candidatus Saccharimonadales bacterium]